MVVVLLIQALMGCSTSRLPPLLAGADLKAIQNLKFNVSVGVERYKFPAYSEHLLSVLRDLNVFNVVEYSDKEIHFDLLVKVESELYGEPVIPLFTIISLGLIPTIVDESYGVIFSIKSGNSQIERNFIFAEYRDTAILGWIALPMRLLPQYSGNDSPEVSMRYKNFIKLKLYENPVLKQYQSK